MLPEYCRILMTVFNSVRGSKQTHVAAGVCAILNAIILFSLGKAHINFSIFCMLTLSVYTNSTNHPKNSIKDQTKCWKVILMTVLRRF